MLCPHPPPSVADLVAIALVHTDFLQEINLATPHDLKICAELSAELAAEHWERSTDTVVGVLESELTGDVVIALVAHATTVRDASDSALYHATARMERAIAELAKARGATAGTLPIAAAEALMDGIEDHFDAIRVALTRSRDVLQVAIDQIERAASRQAVEAA
jgi:hypothetical protein